MLQAGHLVCQRQSSESQFNQEINPMKTIHHVAAAAALAAVLALPAAPTFSAPTEDTRGGATSVRLAPGFVDALTSLKVSPAAIAPGRLFTRYKAVIASFPITTGAVDLGEITAEIDHAGGLSLTAGKTRVELTSFIIDLTGGKSELTGLVTINDTLVGRVPLFDLTLGRGAVGGNDDFLKVDNVSVTLTQTAADALNKAFGITALTRGTTVGTATVRAFLEFEHH
jgi:hypothetical protein